MCKIVNLIWDHYLHMFLKLLEKLFLSFLKIVHVTNYSGSKNHQSCIITPLLCYKHEQSIDFWYINVTHQYCGFNKTILNFVFDRTWFGKNTQSYANTWTEFKNSTFIMLMDLLWFYKMQIPDLTEYRILCIRRR